jgi:short-subunit dehydrogenase
MDILITGASRGIGRETVKQLARKTPCRIFCISRNAEKLAQLQAECQEIGQGTRIVPVPFNLHEIQQKQGQIIEILKNYTSKLDILINNAGHLVNQAFEKFSLEDAQDMFYTNVIMPGFLIQALLPFLSGAKQGSHVVNIGSMAGVQGSSKFPGLSYYSSSKAAITVLSECLAEELKGSGIRVNCLALGAVQTEMLAEAFPGLNVNMDPETMGEFIAEFALTGHRYFNGKVLPVSNTTP